MFSLKTSITALKDLRDEQNSIGDSAMAIYRHVEGMQYGRQRLTKTAVVAVCTTNTRKYDHITPVLKELKWLPVATQSVIL